MDIRVEFSSDSLFGRVDPQAAGWDEQKSIDKFGLALVNAINDRYQQANVEVEHTGRDLVKADGFEDDDEVPWVEQIVQTVYVEWDWLVPVPIERCDCATAAKMAQVTGRTIRAAVERGDVEAVKVGKSWSISIQDLKRWIRDEAAHKRGRK